MQSLPEQDMTFLKTLLSRIRSSIIRARSNMRRRWVEFCLRQAGIPVTVVDPMPQAVANVSRDRGIDEAFFASPDEEAKERHEEINDRRF